MSAAARLVRLPSGREYRTPRAVVREAATRIGLGLAVDPAVVEIAFDTLLDLLDEYSEAEGDRDPTLEELPGTIERLEAERAEARADADSAESNAEKLADARAEEHAAELREVHADYAATVDELNKRAERAEEEARELRAQLETCRASLRGADYQITALAAFVRPERLEAGRAIVAPTAPIPTRRRKKKS